jgi:predicted membrane-bound dolichyl-phosphate-mannose-protein mannosyltransferase
MGVRMYKISSFAMKPSVDTPGLGEPFREADNHMNQRVFGTMALAVGLAVLISVPLAPWRVTTGLLVGGLLSLLNHYWLRNSIAAAFNRTFRGGRPTMAQYVLRYLVLGITIFIFYKLNLISLVAAVAGLCSFVVALFAEALREIYFVIIQREEIT